MKKFDLLLASALTFLGLISCNDKEGDINKVEEYDDSYYAALAVISSSDTNFTTTDSGGTINFKTEGGQVTIAVDCGCGWIAENNATDLFPSSVTSTSLTVTADQNTVEEDLTGAITLKTENQRITFATIAITQTAYGAPEITIGATEWNAPAKGALTTEITVEASAVWTAESADNWLTVEKTDTGISLTVEENEEITERSTKVTLTCTDDIRTATDYITVTQDAAAYVTLEVESLFLSAEAGTATIAVESNFDLDCSYDTSNGWFTVSKADNGLAVTVDANTGEIRDGTVTIIAGDGAENVAEAQLTIAQAGINDMVFTYTITSPNTTTKIPITGTVDCTVNWGDGTKEIFISSRPEHTYAEAGVYDIVVSGQVTAISSDGISTEASPLPLTAVKQWGHTGLTKMESAFMYCGNLEYLPEYTGDSFADVTTFQNFCASCYALKEIPAGIFDNCPKVTSYRSVFNRCYAIKGIPEGLFNNCPEATTFYYAFTYCTSLEEIPAKLFYNCPKATTFYGVFWNCTGLKTIAGELFNCPEATNFSGAFANCPLLEGIPTGMFECPKATDLSFCFQACSNLKSVPTRVFNCPKATTFECAFSSCSALEEVSDDLFANCPEVTSFRQTFSSCSSLKTVPTGFFDKNTLVNDFYCCFYSCSALVEIPERLFVNCPNVTTFYSTFSFCVSLKAIPEGIFDNCSKVTTFHSVFQYCDAITEIPDGLFDSCTAVTDFSFAFSLCSNLKAVPAGLFDKAPDVTTFECLFQSCHSLEKIPVGLFDHNLKATTFTNTFYYCYATYEESPYTEIIVGGETVKVHLYERANYTTELGCSAPKTYDKCFTESTFSDINSIPSDWGGKGN